MHINEVTERIIGAAMAVHRELGPGLLESTYESCLAVHTAQMLTCLKLSGCQVGLLINFNVRLLRDSIKRIVHGLPEPSSRRFRPSVSEQA